jgi:hydrogenase nickel incorporation protein HypA/HybF
MLAQVRRIAAQHGADRVDRIVLVIGPLSGIEIPLLERAFTVARAGTIAASAEFVCEPNEIHVHCRDCGRTTIATINNLTCGGCGDWQIEMQQGDEMLLKTVELSGVDYKARGQRPESKTTTENRSHV